MSKFWTIRDLEHANRTHRFLPNLSTTVKKMFWDKHVQSFDFVYAQPAYEFCEFLYETFRQYFFNMYLSKQKKIDF